MNVGVTVAVGVSVNVAQLPDARQAAPGTRMHGCSSLPVPHTPPVIGGPHVSVHWQQSFGVVGVTVGVCVRDDVGVRVESGVCVGDAVGERLAVGVGSNSVGVAVGLEVGVRVEVMVAVMVAVRVGDVLGVAVRVGVKVTHWLVPLSHDALYTGAHRKHPWLPGNPQRGPQSQQSVAELGVRVGLGVDVSVAVSAGVLVGVSVAVTVGVRVDVGVGVEVRVAVKVAVTVGVNATHPMVASHVASALSMHGPHAPAGWLTQNAAQSQHTFWAWPTCATSSTMSRAVTHAAVPRVPTAIRWSAELRCRSLGEYPTGVDRSLTRNRPSVTYSPLLAQAFS